MLWTLGSGGGLLGFTSGVSREVVYRASWADEGLFRGSTLTLDILTLWQALMPEVVSALSRSVDRWMWMRSGAGSYPSKSTGGVERAGGSRR